MAKKKLQFDLKQFTFIHDFILVRSIREEELANGLVKPQQYDEKPEFGEVIAVGDGRLLDDGVVVPPKVKVGDTIFYGKYSSEQTRSLSEDYFIIRDEDIRAVLKK